MTGNCCSALRNAVPELRVKVIDFDNPCLFYKKKGEVFSLREMVPEGVCPDLFFQIYPQYLSLLYGGTLPGGGASAVIQCPGTYGKTSWEINPKNLLLSPLIDMADMFFRFFGMPKDFISKKIVITLVKAEGECPMGYTAKSSFSFNQYSHLWGRRFFCPAVFYTLYPFLKSHVAVSNVMGSAPCFRCPADNSSILFEILP